MVEKNNENFISAYRERLAVLQKNIFLHLQPSPFPNNVESDDTQIDNIVSKSQKLNSAINSKQKIKTIRTKELEKLQIIADAILSNYDENIMNQIGYRKPILPNLENFKDYVRFFNKLFSFYLNDQLGQSISYNNGYYSNTKFRQQEEIKEIEQNILQNFKTFFQDYFDETIPTTLSIGKNEKKQTIQTTSWQKRDKLPGLEVTLKNFEDYCQKTISGLSAIQSNIKGSVLLKDSYNIVLDEWKKNIEQWIKSRGYNYIAHLYNLSYSTLTKNEKIIKNIETPNYYIEDYYITGSFNGYLGSEKRWGALAEKNFNLILNSLTNKKILKINDKKIKLLDSKVTGQNTINGKQVKADISLTYSYDFDIKKTKKATVQTKKKNDSINFSLKNYKQDSKIKIHSSGKIESVTNYLKNSLPDTIKKSSNSNFNIIMNYLESNEFKYYLVNYGNPVLRKQKQPDSVKFNTNLRKIFGNFGSVFSMGQLFEENNLEKADFLVINSKIIPGSIIMEYLFKNQENITNITWTSIHYPNERAYQVDSKLNPIGKKEPYSSLEDVEKRGKAGKEIANHITYTMLIDNSLRKTLEQIITDI